MDDKLLHLRAEIDELDAQLLPLLQRRLRLADVIGAYKAARGLPVRDPAREAEILARLRETAGADAEDLEELYQTLLRLSRRRQA